MHYLYFELTNPIYLSAAYRGKNTACGRIFVHIHPSGILVIHLAIALGQGQLASLKSMGKAIWETAPWRENPDWVWKTRFASGRLCQVVSVLKDKIIRSLAADKPTGLATRERRWYTTIRFDTAASMETLASGIFKGELKRVELERPRRGFFIDTEEPPEGELMIAKHGLVCKPFQRNLATRLDFVWKLLALLEHALIKDFVYENYASFLAEEVLHLKEIRRTALKSLRPEDIFKLSIYRSAIPRYVHELNDHTRYIPQFQRFVETMILKAIGHPRRVEYLREQLEAWEAEVDKWKNPLGVLLREIIDPLRSLMFGRIYS